MATGLQNFTTIPFATATVPMATASFTAGRADTWNLAGWAQASGVTC